MLANWLIRGRQGHQVEHQGAIKKLGEMAESLTCRFSCGVDYKGKKVGIAISETSITIIRAAKLPEALTQLAASALGQFRYV